MGDPGDLVAEIRLGRQAEQAFQAFDLAPQGLLLLDLQFVGGVEPGQVAPSLEESALGMHAVSPERLEITDERGRKQDRGLELVETHPQEGPAEHGQEDPGGNEHAKGEEGAGLNESFAGQDP